MKTTTLWNDLLNLAFVTVTRFGDDSINELLFCGGDTDSTRVLAYRLAGKREGHSATTAYRVILNRSFERMMGVV